jgi:cell wall-associated NlpC family hydrolase
MSPDPANSDGEQSAYQYCGGDPVGSTDPSGLVSEDTNDFYRAYRAKVENAETQMVAWLRSRVGIWYLWGGDTHRIQGKDWYDSIWKKRGGLDCSGLAQGAYRVANYWDGSVFPCLPRDSKQQHAATRSLGFGKPASALRIGDLGFLHTPRNSNTSGSVHHVGVYIGGSHVIEAPCTGLKIRQISLASFNARGADWHRARH